MSHKKLLSLLCIFSLAITQKVESHSWSSTEMVGVGAAAVITVAASVSFYRWYFKEASNEELCDHAQSLYEAVSEKYGSMALLYNPKLLKIGLNQEGELFDLAGHRDLPRVPDVLRDLPQLGRRIDMLTKRIKRDREKGAIDDDELIKVKEQLVGLHSKLQVMADFWTEHKVFFELHSVLSELARKYGELRTVSQLYDFYTSHNMQALNQLEKQVNGRIVGLASKVGVRYVMLAHQAAVWLDDLKQIQRNIVALRTFVQLEKTFTELDAFARQVSFSTPDELAAKIKAVYSEQEYPFKYVAQKANAAITSLEKSRVAMDQQAILFNTEDSFCPRAVDLLKRSGDLATFLPSLRDTVTSLPGYETDVRRQRKDKKHAQQVALEQQRIQAEKEQEQEKLRLEQERIDAEKERDRAERLDRERHHAQEVALENKRIEKEDAREQERMRLEKEKISADQALARAKQAEADALREAAKGSSTAAVPKSTTAAPAAVPNPDAN